MTRVAAMPDPVEIPNKLYFRIGEVCRLLKLEPYVLRFWESEFPSLSPAKGANGRRMYRRKDVEMVVTIKDLLYDRGYTIAGARKVLSSRRESTVEPAPSNASTAETQARQASPLPEKLDQVKLELRDILTILNRGC
ncbi:MAG: MerR family transcriptional regulator [Acidimicrobiia bacterium]|nr:MerR family transcriptional regulator [Acidimicrobiia bacterium]